MASLIQVQILKIMAAMSNFAELVSKNASLQIKNRKGFKAL